MKKPVYTSCPVQLVAANGNAKSKSAGFTFAFAEEGSIHSKKAGSIILTKDGAAYTLNISLGEKGKCTAETFRRAGGKAGSFLVDHNIAEVDLSVPEINSLEVEGAAKSFLEGLRLGSYRFNSYKEGKKKAEPVKVSVTGGKGLAYEVTIVTDAVMLSRDWAHEPANVINPLTLAERARAIASAEGLTCRIIDDAELKKMGAGLITAVGQGSAAPSRIIILEYAGKNPPKGQKPVVLLGKSLTFDSGGYSLKDSNGIRGMKYDKSGGMTVLATIVAAARLKLANPLIAVLGAAENMVSAQAYRPDDILTSLSGKTVEIASTDAEGRLVLADTLSFIQKTWDPACIIDLATLTGGVVVALGHIRAGIMGNDQSLVDALLAAGARTSEKLWQMPLDDEYLEATLGEDADLKNSGGREASTISGGIFLKQFVADAVPWAHIDIAGVAGTSSDLPYAPKGATGFGVRLLLDFLQQPAA